jgi:DNA-binding NarL/FixJ family response regulator
MATITCVLEAFQGRLLAPDFDIVRARHTGRSLLEEFARLKSRCGSVVHDIGMPLLNGLDAGRQLKAQRRSVKLIYLTMNPIPTSRGRRCVSGHPDYVAEEFGCAGTQGRRFRQALRTDPISRR